MTKLISIALFATINLFAVSSHAQLIQMGKQLNDNYKKTFESSADCKQLISDDQYKIQVIDKNLSTKEYTLTLSALDHMVVYGHIETQTNQTSVVTVDFHTAFISNFLNEENVGMQPCDNDKPENKKKCLEAVGIVQKELEQIQKSIQAGYKNALISNAVYKTQMANIGCAIDLVDTFKDTVKDYK